MFLLASCSTLLDKYKFESIRRGLDKKKWNQKYREICRRICQSEKRFLWLLVRQYVGISKHRRFDSH